MANNSAKSTKLRGSVWGEMKAPQNKPLRTAWLLSFIDLTGILVGFFVLVFSTQTIDRGTWKEVAGSFQAAFASKAAVLPVLPTGNANGYKVVTVRKDTLPYLNSLLMARVANDPVWKNLQGREQGPEGNREMVYRVPETALQQTPEALQAWQRLGNIMRGWKNPLVVRSVVAEDGDNKAAALTSLRLAGNLATVGVAQVAGDVISGKVPAVEWVIRGR